MGALVHLLVLALALPSPIFEGGLQVGVAERQLGNTPFRAAFNAQLYADATIVSRLLSVGGYWNGMPAGDRAPPDRLSAPDVSVTTLGVRAKLFWPRDGFRPYVSLGIGRVSAQFSESRSYDRVAPASLQRFAELPMAVGFVLPLDGPFVMTGEGAYRLGVGYRNEAYDQALHGAASGRAHAWTLHFGLAVSL